MAVSLQGLRFMQRDAFPANNVLENSASAMSIVGNLTHRQVPASDTNTSFLVDHNILYEGPSHPDR